MTAKLAKQALDVGIVTHKGDEALAFYRDLLGFAQLDDIEMPGVGLIHRLQCGQSILRVLVPEEEPEDCAAEGGLTGRAGIRYLTLEVENLRDVVALAESAGIEITVSPIEARPGRLFAQLRDPVGNLVELAQTTA